MRVGFDIGGTFTDVIVLGDEGRLTTAKVLSLLDRVGEDIVACVRQASSSARVENFVHGTTIASNAVIENKTAVTGLMTTKGFREELEMRGQRRPNIYDVNWDRLPPLIPRALRLEVNERILGNGTVEKPLNPEEAREVIKRLLAQGVEAIAVCFINSYLNPVHEQQVGKLIAEIAPQMVVCLSSDIHPEIREYERTSTTAINASLIPVIARYMDRLETHLSTYSDKLLIMQSNGGLMTAQSVRRRPAYTIESGPAAGVLAATRLAEPGPVCYGRGGQEPTVTDANVALGYMNPQSIAGSTLRIDREAAWTAIKKKLADPLGLEVMQTAYGITQVANAAMMRALRAVSTERGRDPREFTLIAFGGAGPIHAAELAASLGMTQVYVPLFPGLFSALGLLLADYRHDYVRSVALALEAVDPEVVMHLYTEMEETARAEMVQEGVPATAVQFARQVDLKYGYQISEITLPFPSDTSFADLRAVLARLFTEAHQREFGYSRDDPIELVSLRLRATAVASRLRFTDLVQQIPKEGSVALSSAVRQAYFGPKHGLQESPIRRRGDIEKEESGPLIVEEPDTTVVVPPGWTIHRDGFGNLVLRHVQAA